MLNRRTFLFLALGGLTTWGLAADGAQAACDLEATFVAPTGTQVAGGGPVTWGLRYRNLGNDPCVAYQIKLHRYTGSTASGSGSQVGGSGGTQALNALAPGQLHNLNFTEQATPTGGTYTYKPSCTSPCNDANNSNQYPTRTVTFTPSAASQTPPDVEVTNIAVMTPKMGPCNDVRVTFKNNGGAINQQWALTLKTFPTTNTFEDNHTYKLMSGALATGQSASLQFRNVNLAASATAQSVADSGQTITEGNEDNNVLTRTFNTLVNCH